MHSLFSPRLAALTTILQEKNLDGLLIFDLYNIRYLTGLNVDFAMLLHKKDGSTIMSTGAIQQEEVQGYCKKEGIDFVLYTPTFPKDFGPSLPPRVGIEDTIPVESFLRWQKECPKTKFLPQETPLKALRSIKSLDEIGHIRTAQHHVDDILEHEFPKLLRPGVTESQVGLQLEWLIRDGGTYELSFPLIVAFGENSSKPHHQNSNRKLRKGDNILVDCGAKYQGYCSDVTRNFALGTPSSEYQNKYDLLLQAQTQSVQTVKAGIDPQSWTAACEKALGPEKDRWQHCLSHGVGLEIHETPLISPFRQESLKEDMVITIEPGIYYPGEFGIRIEDLVWIRAESVETPPPSGGVSETSEVLSRVTKELIVLNEK